MDNCTECGRALEADQNLCTVCGTPRPGFEPTLMRPTPSAPAPRPQEALGVLEEKWALEREIGRGGMGTVYLATDLALDRKVAIKMLSLSLKEEPEVVSRFEREARMLARLEHPNMVPIYAVGRKDGLPFIVMKNLEGSSLSVYLRERGRLPIDEVLAITRQICAGLGFIHSKGIIHRDIKPGNIFIGPDGHVTLLDLGVAHDSNQSLTKSGLLIGTPRYMSPEQILYGSGRIDDRSDLYALAVVLFEMLTGAPVFDGESDFSVMRAHTDLAPPDVAALVPGLPKPVGRVLLKALAKQPQDRYASAGELLTALEGAAARGRSSENATPPTLAPVRPEGPPLQLTQRSDRLERPAQTDASLIAAAGLRRRSKGPAIAVAALASVVLLGAGGYFAFGRDQGPKLMPLPIDAAPTGHAPIAVPAPGSTSAAPSSPAPIVPAPPSARSERNREAPTARTQRKENAPARPSEVRVTTTAGGAPSWAWLDVDGIRKGNTPLILKLAPGTHQLRISRAGFKPMERTVEVVPGRSVRLTLELEK